MSRFHPQKGNDRSVTGAWAPGGPALATHQASVGSVSLSANQRACPNDRLMIVHDPDWFGLSLSLGLFLSEPAAKTMSCLWALAVKPGCLGSSCHMQKAHLQGESLAQRKAEPRDWEEGGNIWCV